MSVSDHEAVAVMREHLTFILPAVAYRSNAAHRNGVAEVPRRTLSALLRL